MFFNIALAIVMDSHLQSYNQFPNIIARINKHSLQIKCVSQIYLFYLFYQNYTLFFDKHTTV